MSLIDADIRSLPLSAQLDVLCTSGRPFRLLDVRIADQDGALIRVPPPGAASQRAIGEVLIRGPTLFGGYLSGPAGESDTFLLEDGFVDGWFKTGDLGAHHFPSVSVRLPLF